MNDTPGPWVHEVDAAWQDFGADLADLLDGLEPGETLSLTGTGSGSGSGGDAAYLRFAVLDGKGVVGEVLGNDGAGRRRLDSKEVVLLSRLGWLRIADEGQPAVTHWSVADPTTYEVMTAMVERTLREVFGVLHPSFLHQEWSHVEVGGGPVRSPGSSTELARLVDAALAAVLGEPAHGARRDDHSDIAIVTGSTMVQIEVADDARSVDVHAVLLRDVHDRGRALSEVNILNRGSGAATYTYRDGQVQARQRIAARPFVPSQLQEAVITALDRYDEIAGDLVGRVGGRRWFSEPEDTETSAPPMDDETTGTAARACLRTVMHLEADQPGSVDPRLAAHIFGYDSRAILNQITRLRHDGRVALVPLLRQALRVVIEQDLERSTR